MFTSAQNLQSLGLWLNVGSQLSCLPCCAQDMQQRLSIDMAAAAASIQHSHVLTIHGTADRTIPVEDAHKFADHIEHHTLRTVEGANHRFSQHGDEAIALALDFITSPFTDK